MVVSNEKIKQMKECKVPMDKWQKLCPDPRLFSMGVMSFKSMGMRGPITEGQIIERMRELNKFCEEMGCQFLKSRMGKRQRKKSKRGLEAFL